MSDEIRIYVTDLAAYNNGKLHRVWVDATLEFEDMQEAVSEIFKTSPEGFSEEYAIHDHEGFGSYRLGAYEGLEYARKLACFIEEHGELSAEALAHFSDIDEAQHQLENNYAGCYKSVADFAEELTEQTSEVPENLARYIDYGSMAYDLEAGGDIFTIALAHDEVHVFWNR